MVSPLVDEIAEEHPEFTVGKVNVDEQPELAPQFHVMSIPSLFVLKNGKIVNQAIGKKSTFHTVILGKKGRFVPFSAHQS